MSSKALFGLLLLIALVNGKASVRNPCIDGNSICVSCNTFDYCILKNGIFQPAGANIECEYGRRCVNGACVAFPEEECPPDYATVIVSKPGIYPHPFSCEKYLVSDDGEMVEEHSCPSNFMFDVTTGRCSLNFTMNFCRPYTTAVCPSNGFLPIRDFSKFYFHCDEYGETTIGECRDGRIFIGHYGDCWNMNNAYLDGGMCPGAGKFYHPDCTKYNECAGKDETPVLKTCPDGNKFNYHYEKCMPVKCYL